MKRFAFAVLILAACGGPSRQQLVETPSATSRARPAEAPAASTSDKDREGLVQGFDDMQTTQDAYKEAGQASSSAAPKPSAKSPASPPGKTPVKNAPASPPQQAPVQ